MKNKRTKQISRSTEDKKKRRIRPTPKKEKRWKKRGETIKGNQRRKKRQKKNKDRNIGQFQPNTTQIFPEKKKKKNQIDPICTGTCQDDPKFLYHNKSQKKR